MFVTTLCLRVKNRPHLKNSLFQIYVHHIKWSNVHGIYQKEFLFVSMLPMLKRFADDIIGIFKFRQFMHFQYKNISALNEDFVIIERLYLRTRLSYIHMS